LSIIWRCMADVNKEVEMRVGRLRATVRKQ
jgi:hypothetical protein